MVSHRVGGAAMTAVWVAIAVAILTLAGGVLGLYLQKMLPDQHSVEKSRDMIGSVMGLVTLLLALVLGTIVGSAYFFSATQQSELQAFSAQAIQLDEALAQFGPEAKPLRDKWKENLDRVLKLFWGGGNLDLGDFTSQRRWLPCKHSRAPSGRSTRKPRIKRTLLRRPMPPWYRSNRSACLCPCNSPIRF